MVAERVLAEHEQGTRLREQAVLMRTGHHSALLELELGRRRIPFVKYGGIRYLEAAHVKDFLALVRLVVNPADEIAWFRILQLLDQIGPRTARRILDTLDRQNPAGWPQQWSKPRAPRQRPQRRQRPDRRGNAGAEDERAGHRRPSCSRPRSHP